MLTKHKTYALCMFAHSRLTGKMSEVLSKQGDKMITQAHEEQNIQAQVQKYINKLESEHMTVDILNSLPDSFLARQITYYYDLCLTTLKTHIKKGDAIVETILGLSIINYLEEEKQLVSSDVNTSILIEKFESLSTDRSLNSHMLKVGAYIVEAIDKANYTKYLKNLRKQNKKKQHKENHHELTLYTSKINH